ncbi:MAG: hypothetical protein JNN01_19840 [Opitutaceae bacterium]|nr:hypothetical protein [Opitutaceae bacterium]
MDIFLPTLEEKMTTLVGALRFIVFTIMVAGLIAHFSRDRVQDTAALGIIFKASVIVAAIAFQGTWFPQVERFFLNIADYIDPGYNEHPTQAADTIRESTTTNPERQEWSWRRLNESIYQAMSNAMANIFIYVGTLLTVPMLILQYVLRWILFLLTPFMLALFLVPGFSGIAIRFLQQLLAILAWPVGFAITNLVALAIWHDFRDAVGANPSSVSDVVYSPLLTFMGGILATIMIIVGMGATPFVMQALFAQGQGFTGQSGSFGHLVSTGSRSIYGLSHKLERSGPVAPAPMNAPVSAPPSTPPPLTTARPGI